MDTSRRDIGQIATAAFHPIADSGAPSVHVVGRNEVSSEIVEGGPIQNGQQIARTEAALQPQTEDISFQIDRLAPPAISTGMRCIDATRRPHRLSLTMTGTHSSASQGGQQRYKAEFLCDLLVAPKLECAHLLDRDVSRPLSAT